MAIVRAARACIGTPFRPQGRRPGEGLDCVGVVTAALAGAGIVVDPPRDYALSDTRDRDIDAPFIMAGLVRVPDTQCTAGDIIVFHVSCRQRHLAVMTGSGIVHAHIGLRRVVETPLPLPWPPAAVWHLFPGE